MLQKVYNVDGFGELQKSKNLLFDTQTDGFRRVDYDENNYIFNFDPEQNMCELIVYDKPFQTPRHTDANADLIDSELYVKEFESFMGTRKFRRDENGYVQKLESSATLYDLQKTMHLGGKRARKTFYNYALANKWEYFCTFTLSDSQIRNDAELLSETWTKFVRMLKRLGFPKALAIYEEFEKGGFHFHALLGDVDLRLIPARNNNSKSEHYREFMYSKVSGVQLFNCADWPYGFSTVAPIAPESNQAQVVNYMSKYMTKCSAAPYGCKRFFRTQNLDVRQSEIGYAKDFEEWKCKFGMQLVKNTNGIKVYRNYGTRFMAEERVVETNFVSQIMDISENDPYQFGEMMSNSQSLYVQTLPETDEESPFKTYEQMKMKY